MINNITYLQLRSARQALNLGIREIAKLLRVSKATVNKAELGKTRDFFFKHSAALTEFFKNNSITFPSEYMIRFHPEEVISGSSVHNKVILTRFQLKGARHIAQLSQSELAQIIGIDKGVISRAESISNEKPINLADESITLKIKNVFLEYYIEFHDPLSIFFKKYIDNELDR